MTNVKSKVADVETSQKLVDNLLLTFMKSVCIKIKIIWLVKLVDSACKKKWISFWLNVTHG